MYKYNTCVYSETCPIQHTLGDKFGVGLPPGLVGLHIVKKMGKNNWE